MSKENKSNIPLILISLVVLAGLAAGAYFLFKDSQPPEVAITPDALYLGADSQLTVDTRDPGAGLKRLKVVVIQGGTEKTVLEQEYPEGTLAAKESLPLADLGVKEGEFSVRVTAKDASFYPLAPNGTTQVERAYTLDTAPPRIFVKTHTNNLNQGGSALMIYTLSEQASQTGIRVGDRFFPAYLQPDTGAELVYYCMLAIPWDTPPSAFKPMIEATDPAGNTAKRSFNFHANARAFRSDSIGLSDSFMEATVPQFTGLPQTGSVLESYLYINRDMRKANRDKLIELGRDTSNTMLWSGTFARLPNAANRARFADARDYLYNGKVVDHQTHLGLDLASVQQAPVPAGNDGRVVWADFLGIYGNCVVIDHGLGLQTLYAHLSSIQVAPDDAVTKDQIIGHTGATGLAGGDHLHYGVIVSGTPVQPIEWWDPQWIDHNITSKLQ